MDKQGKILCETSKAVKLLKHRFSPLLRLQHFSTVLHVMLTPKHNITFVATS